MTLAQSLRSFWMAPPRSIRLTSSIHVVYRNAISLHSNSFGGVVQSQTKLKLHSNVCNGPETWIWDRSMVGLSNIHQTRFLGKNCIRRIFPNPVTYKVVSTLAYSVITSSKLEVRNDGWSLTILTGTAKLSCFHWYFPRWGIGCSCWQNQEWPMSCSPWATPQSINYLHLILSLPRAASTPALLPVYCMGSAFVIYGFSGISMCEFQICCCTSQILQKIEFK